MRCLKETTILHLSCFNFKLISICPTISMSNSLYCTGESQVLKTAHLDAAAIMFTQGEFSLNTIVCEMCLSIFITLCPNNSIETEHSIPLPVIPLKSVPIILFITKICNSVFLVTRIYPGFVFLILLYLFIDSRFSIYIIYLHKICLTV